MHASSPAAPRCGPDGAGWESRGTRCSSGMDPAQGRHTTWPPGHSKGRSATWTGVPNRDTWARSRGNLRQRRVWEALIEIDELTDLVDPVVIAAFEGWNDAVDAASRRWATWRTRWDAKRGRRRRPRGVLRLLGDTSAGSSVRMANGAIVWPANELYGYIAARQRALHRRRRWRRAGAEAATSAHLRSSMSGRELEPNCSSPSAPCWPRAPHVPRARHRHGRRRRPGPAPRAATLARRRPHRHRRRAARCRSKASVPSA